MDYIKLFEGLSELKGKYKPNAPLAKLTWFKVGGAADILFEPKDVSDLQYFLQNCPMNMPLTIIGLGSNLLIRDGGIRGVVIRLKGNGFSYIEHEGDVITAGAGTPDIRIAKYAAKLGMGGFSFLSGIPGNLGGALRMNAGAFGGEIKDIFISAKAIDRQGNIHKLSFQDMGFSYRHCDIPPDWIFLQASFKSLGEQEPATLEGQIEEIRQKRDDAQPKGVYTGGSTFANPPGHSAWKLIDEAGLRGYKIGDAQVSEKHCNFLLNLGHATAKDIEDLGEYVRAKVKENSGIELRWEIRRLGHPEGT